MVLKLLAGLFVVVMSLGVSALAETGADAFARRDFEAAHRLWLEQAETGDPEASLGLGALSDLGLGVPRDPERAFRYYLEAADAGLAEAQFNVAVMLDSGTVQAGTPAAAAVWYGRAAANGFPRAEYNLGTMFESGDGVDRNTDLARVWLSRAGENIPAANERLERLASPIGQAFEPPRIMGGFRVDAGSEPRAELVWTAPPVEDVTGFLVQLARLPDDPQLAGEILEGTETGASAIVLPLPDPDARYAWRVIRIDRDRRRYAASPWQPLDSEAAPNLLPRASITFRIREDDANARRLALYLGRSLARSGIWSDIATGEEMPGQSTVSYMFESDRDIARKIAEYLPVLGSDDVRKAEFIGSDPRPGQIIVDLVGGLSTG